MANTAPSLTRLLHLYNDARTYSLALTTDLSEEQVNWRPHTQASAIGWHLGHQAAVNHYLVRNLTAAEPSFDRHLDALFDSATPEPERGNLPSFERVVDYRNQVADSTHATVSKIISGDVGAPGQLGLIADGLLRAVINHEYQHAAWIKEVRETLVDTPSPSPSHEHLSNIEGYWMVDLGSHTP